MREVNYNKITAYAIFAVIAVFALILSCSPSKRLDRATNLVLSNPSAIAKVGAVYDALTPRDTAERLVFIQGDSIFSVKTDTAIITDHIFSRDTIRITNTIHSRRTDTILKQLPRDNRLLSRITDSAAHYKRLFAEVSGKAAGLQSGLKTAETRLIWMAGILLLAGVVIGVLVKFKLKV